MSAPVLYTLNPAEPTDVGWSTYNQRWIGRAADGSSIVATGAGHAAARRAARLGISVTVEKNGKPWRIVHPSGRRERLDLGPGRGALRGKPGHRRAVLVNHDAVQA